MALLPKTTAVATTAPAPSARSVPPGTRVAAISTSQVDELETGTNISFDAAASSYQEQQQDNNRLSSDGRGGGQSAYRDPTIGRLFSSNSQSFAEMFEDRAVDATARKGGTGPAGGNNEPVGKIISTYENNALIISGQQPLRGTSLSMSL